MSEAALKVDPSAPELETVEIPTPHRLAYAEIDYRPKISEVLRTLMGEAVDIREFERRAIERAWRAFPVRSQIVKACDLEAAYRMIEVIGLDFDGFVAWANPVRRKAGLPPIEKPKARKAAS